jgi:hypothetical protein
MGSAVDQALARMPAPPPERLNDLRTSMFRLLNTRAEIVQALLLQQNRLATVQGDAEQTLHDLVTSTDKLDNILDARLLWTPSHKPIDAAWFAQLSQDFGDFLRHTPLGARGRERRTRDRRGATDVRRRRDRFHAARAWLAGVSHRSSSSSRRPMRRIRTDRPRADRQGPVLDARRRGADGVCVLDARLPVSDSCRAAEISPRKPPTRSRPSSCRRMPWPACA